MRNTTALAMTRFLSIPMRILAPRSSQREAGNGFTTVNDTARTVKRAKSCDRSRDSESLAKVGPLTDAETDVGAKRRRNKATVRGGTDQKINDRGVKEVLTAPR